MIMVCTRASALDGSGACSARESQSVRDMTRIDSRFSSVGFTALRMCATTPHSATMAPSNCLTRKLRRVPTADWSRSPYSVISPFSFHDHFGAFSSFWPIEEPKQNQHHSDSAHVIVSQLLCAMSEAEPQSPSPSRVRVLWCM